MGSKNNKGDSSIQRQAQGVIQAALEQELGIKENSLSKAPPDHLAGIELDGFYGRESLPICVEIWAHQGKAKSAQQAKIIKDMAKLILAEKWLNRPCRKIFAVCDSEAIAHLENSWHGEFAAAFGIEIAVVNVDASVKRKIRQAQKEQYR